MHTTQVQYFLITITEWLWRWTHAHFKLSVTPKKKTTEIHTTLISWLLYFSTQRKEREMWTHDAWHQCLKCLWCLLHGSFFIFNLNNIIMLFSYCCIWCNITIHRNNNTKFRFVQQTYWLSIQFYYYWRFYEKKVTVWHLHYIQYMVDI